MLTGVELELRLYHRPATGPQTPLFQPADIFSEAHLSIPTVPASVQVSVTDHLYHCITPKRST